MNSQIHERSRASPAPRLITLAGHCLSSGALDGREATRRAGEKGPGSLERWSDPAARNQITRFFQRERAPRLANAPLAPRAKFEAGPFFGF